MNLIATIALLTYPLFVLATFLLLSSSKAVFASYIVAWLYLPLTTVDIPGLPNYGKFSAASIIILPCLVFFALPRIVRVRFHPADLAVATWIMIPFASSVVNGLGFYDGMSGAVNHFITFAIPYLAGKIALQGVTDWCDLIQTITLGTATYIPLCIFEMKMSAQLHDLIYGFSGRASFEYVGLFGPFGWPPAVFMNSAFEISMMFVISTLLVRGAHSAMPSKLFGVSRENIPRMLVIMVILCKKWSGLGLLVLGLLAIRFKSKLIVTLVFMIPIMYMVLFSTGLYRGEGLSDRIAEFSERRAESLQFRIDNDIRLVEKAMQQPMFGWGGWGRNRVFNDQGADTSVTDSLWMIVLGTFGTVGLVAMCSIYILPSVSFLVRKDPSNLDVNSSPSIRLITGIGLSCSMILALHLIDNLFNAFPNSVFPMLAGGMSVFRLLRYENSIEGEDSLGRFEIAEDSESLRD